MLAAILQSSEESEQDEEDDTRSEDELLPRGLVKYFTVHLIFETAYFVF